MATDTVPNIRIKGKGQAAVRRARIYCIMRWQSLDAANREIWNSYCDEHDPYGNRDPHRHSNTFLQHFLNNFPEATAHMCDQARGLMRQ